MALQHFDFIFYIPTTLQKLMLGRAFYIISCRQY